MNMFGDNKTSFMLIKNLESQNCTKHINIIYHHIPGLVEDRQLGIESILSLLMFIDDLTKALSLGSFKRHQEK